MAKDFLKTLKYNAFYEMYSNLQGCTLGQLLIWPTPLMNVN